MEGNEYAGKLKADCANCQGLCCVALYFFASEGFPKDKEPGQPCCHMQTDYRCAIYPELHNRGLKGCMAFDCFGAGQKATRVSFAGKDWRQGPELARSMFAVFLTLRQLHEMLWYLNEAFTHPAARPIYDDLQTILEETDALTRLGPDDLLQLEVDAHRERVNRLLLQTSELVRGEVLQNRPGSGRKNKYRRGARLMGNDMRKADLRGANLRGALLIAADLRGNDLYGTDLIGADFRDTDIRGTDLSHSLFLTQAQVNAARGDHTTRLPAVLDIPRTWGL